MLLSTDIIPKGSKPKAKPKKYTHPINATENTNNEGYNEEHERNRYGNKYGKYFLFGTRINNNIGRISLSIEGVALGLLVFGQVILSLIFLVVFFPLLFCMPTNISDENLNLIDEECVSKTTIKAAKQYIDKESLLNDNSHMQYASHQDTNVEQYSDEHQPGACDDAYSSDEEAIFVDAKEIDNPEEYQKEGYKGDLSQTTTTADSHPDHELMLHLYGSEYEYPLNSHVVDSNVADSDDESDDEYTEDTETILRIIP